MSWFLAALSGYFLYALAGTIDKILLRQRAMNRPLVFTFYISLLSVFTFVLAPFGLRWPGLAQFGLAFLVGVIFFFGLLCFYRALDNNDASQAMPIIGGLVPIFVLTLASLFLGEHLGLKQLAAFCLLVLGGFLISFKRTRHGGRALKDVRSIILAILLNAIYLVSVKYIFEQQGFITGFIWTRVGMVAAALMVLFYPVWRRAIFSGGRQASKGLGAVLVLNKISAGIGSTLVNWAVSLGSVSLVNALQGTEYAFLLVIVIVFSKKFPRLLEEKTTWPIILQKSIAVILIGAGLAVIAL